MSALYTYASNDFLWTGSIGRNQTRVYEGKRANRNLFVIQGIGGFNKVAGTNPNWMVYRVQGDDIVASLQKGVKGRYQSRGSYWRECTLKLGVTIPADRLKNNNRPTLAQR